MMLQKTRNLQIYYKRGLNKEYLLSWINQQLYRSMLESKRGTYRNIKQYQDQQIEPKKQQEVGWDADQSIALSGNGRQYEGWSPVESIVEFDEVYVKKDNKINDQQ